MGYNFIKKEDQKKTVGDKTMEKVYCINYDGLWKLLIDKHMMKKDLQQASSLSSNVITKMGKGESVTLETLAKICVALKCELSDIVEIRVKEV